METGDYIQKIKERISELVRKNPADDVLDKQELAEREGAAKAYAGENEAHFVDYCHDCIKTSVKANVELRKNQKDCYDVYKEKEPANYANKEAWQSRVVIPKPFGSVQIAMSAVRKAFSPNFLSIENETNENIGDFWQKLMIYQLNKDHANFSSKFTDATGMGFAVGQSLEMIPIWKPGRGLRYILVEPWKIHRDPDATTREPQSGTYWIHQEYLDYYILKELEKSGKYINIDKAKENVSAPSTTDTHLSKEEIARRRGKLYERSKYRKAILASEFWGIVLDPKGNLLLPRATYTVGGNNVIELPRVSPYSTLRWPGVSFSPLPDFLAFEGRGIIQGVKSLWIFMCSLLCLHNDNMNWVVNPMTEVELTALMDQSDLTTYPGKTYLTRGSQQGQQVVRTVERKSRSTDVLANLKFAAENYQEGTFVNDAIQGKIGYREITARQAAQNLDQAMGVFGLMGENVEDGAINAIKGGAETIVLNAGVEDLGEVFGESALIQQLVNEDSPTGIKLPVLNGSFHVSGLSAILKDNETMQNIKEAILPLVIEDTPFAKYLKPYDILKAIEARLNLKDEGLVVSETDAKDIDEAERQQQAGRAEEEAEAVAQEQEDKSRLHEEKLEKIERDKQNLDLKLVKEAMKE